MIALGLRLATAGGRRQALALVLTGIAVAVGTAFLLLAFTVEPAYAARDVRGGTFRSADAPPLAGAVPAGPLTAVRAGNDAFRDMRITLVELAGFGPQAPQPAGVPLPRPGELLVSRGLAALAEREPLLAERYPPASRLLSDEAVPSPASLVAVRGVPPADVRADGRWTTTREFGVPGDRDGFGPVFDLVVVLGAVAMLAPIVVFVATATRLTATGRERRLAALRLAGATTGQMTRLAAAEALLTGVAGGTAGIGLFLLVRPLATAVTIDEPWYVTDLTPPPAGFAVALIGVPLAALVGALVALRRTAISPLGVGRRARPRPLRAARLVPLVLAAALFVGLARSWPDTVPLAISFTALLAALLYAGPWLTRVLGAGLARLGSPAALLAGRRLTGDPRLGFRSVGGAVLGAFVVALFITVTPALRTEIDPAAISGLGPDVAVGRADGQAEARSAESALAGAPGITVVTVRTLFSDAGDRVWVGDCRALARIAGIDAATCGPGRVLTAPDQPGLQGIVNTGGEPVAVRGEPAAVLPGGGVDRPLAIVPDDAVDVLAPDATSWQVAIIAAPDALEDARTRLAAAGVRVDLATATMRTGEFSRDSADLDKVLRAALLATFLLAGCSAAVAAATGLLERRRSFALLRLAGTPLAVLRRSAGLELAVPLLASSLVAAALGVLAGRLVGLAGGADQPVPWAALGVPLAVGAAIALALGSLALPLVSRATNGEAARFE